MTHQEDDALARGRSLTGASATGSPRSPQLNGSRLINTCGWCVRVSVFDDLVVSISERELCGRDLSEADKDLIRHCARHLLAFVGSRD